jgi:hypothetical protein
MIAHTHWLHAASVLVLVVSMQAAAPQEQKSSYRDADQKELTSYVLSMEKIRKLGEVEKAADEIFDKDFNVRDAWNDHGVGELLTIGASVRSTDTEFPQIAAAIHKAGLCLSV